MGGTSAQQSVQGAGHELRVQSVPSPCLPA
jgi:hypothetical protein